MLKHENYLWSKLLIPAISSKNAKLPTKKFDQITTYISDFELSGFGLDLLSLKQGRDGKNKIAVKSSSRQPKTPVSQAASSLSSWDSQAPDCTGNSPNKYLCCSISSAKYEAPGAESSCPVSYQHPTTWEALMSCVYNSTHTTHTTPSCARDSNCIIWSNWD